MKSILKAKLFLAALAAGLTLAFVGLTGPSVMAQSSSATTPVQVVPLEIEPVCADSTKNKAYWKVTNKNTFEVDLSWSNDADNQSGQYNTPAAVVGNDNVTQNNISTMATSFLAGSNNTTSFSYTGQNPTSTNSSNTPCSFVEPTEPDCIDGKTQQNLEVIFLSPNIASVQTIDGRLLCEDIVVSFSSYKMPDNYDGKGFFGNSTATPQSIIDSLTVTLEAGTTGSVILELIAIDDCLNVQTDVYYGNEIVNIGPDGHGTINILSDVFVKTATDCNDEGGNPVVPVTPVTPVNPSLPVEPPTNAPVVTGGMGGNGNLIIANPVVTKVGEGGKGSLLPATLPVTGPSLNNPASLLPAILIAGFMAGIMAYCGANAFQTRRYN